MAVKFIEFKKQLLDGDPYKELFAEAIFDKTYLRKVIYHDPITPIPEFKEYITSGQLYTKKSFEKPRQIEIQNDPKGVT